MVLMTVTTLATVACNGNQPASQTDNAQQPTCAETLSEEQHTILLSAVSQYLKENVGIHYTEASYCIPTCHIVATDEQNAEDILVWGDFWVFNYNLEGDTLKTVSGGNHPGLMHLRKTDNGYEVIAFDQVKDGSCNQKSAKRIFGDKYQDFHAINSDAEQREQLRAKTLSDFVNKQGLPATLYQDYGYPANKLP